MKGDAFRLLRRLRATRSLNESQSKDEIWADWMALGVVLIDCRERARREAGWRTRGRYYAAKLKAEMQDAMRSYYADYQRLDSSTLSYLTRCMENYDAVNAWRDSQQPEATRPSSPTRVWQRYRADTNHSMYLASYLATHPTPPLLQ